MTTAAEMQHAFAMAEHQSFDIVAPNIYLDWRYGEADLLCLRKSGYIEEIEIKISKADFKADFKKTSSIKLNEPEWNGFMNVSYKKIGKHEAMMNGHGLANRFYFFMPEGLVDIDGIPAHAGLFVDNGKGRIIKIRNAPLLHKNKITERQKFELGRKMGYRYWDLIRKERMKR